MLQGEEVLQAEELLQGEEGLLQGEEAGEQGEEEVQEALLHGSRPVSFSVLVYFTFSFGYIMVREHACYLVLLW